MSSPPRQRPSVPLRCAKCGGMKIKVGGFTKAYRRTFRRDTDQTPHLHAPVQCLGCEYEWWSAHESAIKAATDAEAANVPFHIVQTERVQPGTKRRRKPLSALLATSD